MIRLYDDILMLYEVKCDGCGFIARYGAYSRGALHSMMRDDNWESPCHDEHRCVRCRGGYLMRQAMEEGAVPFEMMEERSS